MTRTPAERQAEYRQRRIATGLKALTLWLPPEALAVLESYPREQRDRIAAQAILAYNGNVTVTNTNGIHPALEALTRRVEALEGALTLHNSDVTKTEHKAEPRESEVLVSKAHELHAQGVSWDTIARRWNAEGIPTLTGRGQWHGGNVKRMIGKRGRVEEENS